MNRQAQNLLLLLFGAAITLIAVTGTYLNYVRPVMLWILLASGAVILALAVAGMAADVRSATGGDVADGHGGHEGHDGHGHGGGAIGWLLVVPVLLLLFAPPPPLGAGTTSSQVAVVASADPVLRDFPPLPAGPAPSVSLYDFQNRAVSDGTRALERTDVTLTGFVQRAGGTVRLARLMIWCCVADARAIEVDLRGAGVTVADGAWVQAVVRLVPGSATRADEYRPAATVASWRAVPAPRNPYD